MDDSDRSRDEPSAPEDDSVDGDGTVDSADATSDEAVGMPGGTSENRRSAGDENGDDTGPESVEPEVSPEVTSEIGADAGDADNSTRRPSRMRRPLRTAASRAKGPRSKGPPKATRSSRASRRPETDEEMPLAAHIEEMMRRLAVVFVFGGLATLVVVTESTELINYFWGYHIPAPLRTDRGCTAPSNSRSRG